MSLKKWWHSTGPNSSPPCIQIGELVSIKKCIFSSQWLDGKTLSSLSTFQKKKKQGEKFISVLRSLKLWILQSGGPMSKVHNSILSSLFQLKNASYNKILFGGWGVLPPFLLTFWQSTVAMAMSTPLFRYSELCAWFVLFCINKDISPQMGWFSKTAPH